MSVTYTYKWQRTPDNGSTVTDIPGAAGSFVGTSPFTQYEDYGLVSADEGDKVRIQITDGVQTWNSPWTSTIIPASVGGGSGTYLFEGDFLSGQYLKSSGGKWDGQESSGVGSISVVTDTGRFGSQWSKYAKFVMSPGSQTQSGWHNRQLIRLDSTSLFMPSPAPNGIGKEVYLSGGFNLPSGPNNSQYKAEMVMELFHGNNSLVHAMIAPIGLFVGPPLETWDGSAFHSISNQPWGIELRLATGYVQHSTGTPYNQSYWHANIQIPGYTPVKYDRAIWFVFHIIMHEYAGGSPPGGWNTGTFSAPRFNGSDTQAGTLRLWMVDTALGSQPSAAAFNEASPLLAWNNNIPTLIYTDDGSGNAVHDTPYGPFIGSYSSSDSISWTSEADWAGCWAAEDFATAVDAIAV